MPPRLSADSMTVLCQRTHRLAQHGGIMVRSAAHAGDSLRSAAAMLERVDAEPLLAALRRLDALTGR